MDRYVHPRYNVLFDIFVCRTRCIFACRYFAVSMENCRYFCPMPGKCTGQQNLKKIEIVVFFQSHELFENEQKKYLFKGRSLSLATFAQKPIRAKHYYVTTREFTPVSNEWHFIEKYWVITFNSRREAIYL